MANESFSLSDFLSEVPATSVPPSVSESDFTGEGQGIFRELGYSGNIDYRLRQVSYSSLLDLHSCPKKFQLKKLRSTYKTAELEKSTITFAFGHVVGDALQQVLMGTSFEDILFKMFLGWHTNLFAQDDKLAKSLFHAITAVERFIHLRETGFLDEYELVEHEGKPACELSFSISFPDGFRLRGFVDAVLRHKITGKVIVLELKTTGASRINPATYKNSAQAIGYSIVLDAIFPELSSYEVLYLIYQTKTRTYTPIPFPKSFLQRAIWIREVLLDLEIIKMYEEAEVYPMRGESCTNFERDCEFLNYCTLPTSAITKPCTPEEEDVTDYQIKISLEDLLDSQLSKVLL
jgi:hypothetical protein